MFKKLLPSFGTLRLGLKAYTAKTLKTTHLALTHRVRAFTLTEVLVVFVVMAVLATLMFPVFGTMIRSSKEAACMSNLRQLYVGIQAYASDNSGRYPKTSHGPNSGSEDPNSGSTSYWSGWFFNEVYPDYVGDKGVAKCPLLSEYQMSYSSPTGAIWGQPIARFQGNDLLLFDRWLPAHNRALAGNPVGEGGYWSVSALYADGSVILHKLVPGPNNNAFFQDRSRTREKFGSSIIQ